MINKIHLPSWNGVLHASVHRIFTFTTILFFLYHLNCRVVITNSHYFSTIHPRYFDLIHPLSEANQLNTVGFATGSHQPGSWSNVKTMEMDISKSCHMENAGSGWTNGVLQMESPIGLGLNDSDVSSKLPNFSELTQNFEWVSTINNWTETDFTSKS